MTQDQTTPTPTPGFSHHFMRRVMALTNVLSPKRQVPLLVIYAEYDEWMAVVSGQRKDVEAGFLALDLVASQFARTLLEGALADVDNPESMAFIDSEGELTGESVDLADAERRRSAEHGDEGR